MGRVTAKKPQLRADWKAKGGFTHVRDKGLRFREVYTEREREREREKRGFCKQLVMGMAGVAM